MKNQNSDTYRRQHKRVQKAFKKQATGWSKRQDKLSGIAKYLNLQPHFNVLDVAAGTALLARSLAPYVNLIVACDVTLEMLQQAQRQAYNNMQFVQTAAEELPHPSGSFDRVVTRYALHHCQAPKMVLSEVYRVCHSGGTIAVIDIVAPEDQTLAQRYNEMERLRDPAHTEALSFSALKGMIVEVGFILDQTTLGQADEMDARAWFELTQTAGERRQQVLNAVNQELAGGLETGLYPFYRQGELKIINRVATVIAQK